MTVQGFKGGVCPQTVKEMTRVEKMQLALNLSDRVKEILDELDTGFKDNIYEAWGSASDLAGQISRIIEDLPREKY